MGTDGSEVYFPHGKSVPHSSTASGTRKSDGTCGTPLVNHAAGGVLRRDTGAHHIAATCGSSDMYG